jgi:hypothetical protein
MFTSIGVVLLSIWLIVEHHHFPNSTFSLIVGIVALILAGIDLIMPYARRTT